MKNSLTLVTTIILLFCTWSVKGLDLDIQKTSNDTIIITWDATGISDVQNINIYIYEGFLKGFPPEKVDALNPKAKRWNFVKSKRNDFFGFDLRDQANLFNKTLWTASEIYTIGIEIEYLDVATQKSAYQRTYDYVFPFTIHDYDEVITPSASFTFEKMPSSFKTFQKGNSFGFPSNQKHEFEYAEIQKITETETSFEIYLASQKRISYEKPPERPDFLGNFSSLIYPLVILGLVFVLVTSFLVYLHINAVHLKDTIDNELYENDKKQALLSFIGEKKSAVYILFYLVKYFDNKNDLEANWHKKIKIAFRKYRLFQANEIKESIDEIITTNKIFKGMDSRKIFISYNHKDQSTAKKIKEKLEAADFEVIIDIEAMKTGESIEDFIKECIKQSAVTLSLISTNSLVSAWVAMETNFSFYDEVLRGKYFVPCNIDQLFFQRTFADDALDKIKIEIDDIKNIIAKRLDQNRGIEDLQLELTRYNKLYHELPSILAKLKNSLCIDLSPENFDEGMDKVIQDIKAFYHTKK